jgi:hypothetical protein
MQPEGGADRLWQLRNCCADPLQGLARGGGHLRRPNRRVGGVDGLVEMGEQPSL